MLRIILANNNICTCQAESDVDKLIVETAITLQLKNVECEIDFMKPSRG